MFLSFFFMEKQVSLGNNTHTTSPNLKPKKKKEEKKHRISQSHCGPSIPPSYKLPYHAIYFVTFCVPESNILNVTSQCRGDRFAPPKSTGTLLCISSSRFLCFSFDLQKFLPASEVDLSSTLLHAVNMFLLMHFLSSLYSF